jgi:hypothetical protein
MACAFGRKAVFFFHEPSIPGFGMAAPPYPDRKTKELKEFLQTLNGIYMDGLSEG